MNVISQRSKFILVISRLLVYYDIFLVMYVSAQVISKHYEIIIVILRYVFCFFCKMTFTESFMFYNIPNLFLELYDFSWHDDIFPVIYVSMLVISKHDDLRLVISRLIFFSLKLQHSLSPLRFNSISLHSCNFYFFFLFTVRLHWQLYCKTVSSYFEMAREGTHLHALRGQLIQREWVTRHFTS